MKLFIVLFLVVMIILLSGTAVSAVLTTSRALSFGAVSEIAGFVSDAKSDIAFLYGLLTGREKELLEDISGRLDEATALAAKQEVFKAYYLRRLLTGFGAVAAAAGFFAFFLWYGTLRAIVNPLNMLESMVRTFDEEETASAVEERGVREIRNLSGAFNDMMKKIDSMGSTIRTMERANIGRFLVHQIRNSITSIELCAGSLNADANAGKIVLEETVRISRLLERFRLLYRFPEPVKTPVELNSLGGDVKLQAPDLILETAPEPVWIEADATLLFEALLNLVQNGREACEGSSRGIVRLIIEGGDRIGVRIIDNGRGIDEREKTLIFSEYYTTKQNGMGLGLNFVKNVADKHGFTLEVNSAPGKGTEVRMAFS